MLKLFTCMFNARDPGTRLWIDNLASRWFLLSLWWQELVCLAILLYLALLAVACLALRYKASEQAADNSVPINHRTAERTN